MAEKQMFKALVMVELLDSGEEEGTKGGENDERLVKGNRGTTIWAGYLERDGGSGVTGQGRGSLISTFACFLAAAAGV